MDVRNIQLPTPGPGGPAQTDQAARVQRRGADGKTAVPRSAAGDSIAISAEARQALYVDGLVQRVLAMPGVRPEAVAAALATPESIDATVDALIRAS